MAIISNPSQEYWMNEKKQNLELILIYYYYYVSMFIVVLYNWQSV